MHTNYLRAVYIHQVILPCNLSRENPTYNLRAYEAATEKQVFDITVHSHHAADCGHIHHQGFQQSTGQILTIEIICQNVLSPQSSPSLIVQFNGINYGMTLYVFTILMSQKT